MDFFDKLNLELSLYNLLEHPFYQAMGSGELKYESLKIYFSEYYHHINALPRYISTIHSMCNNLKIRQMLLCKLIEEEQLQDDSTELWKNFAEKIWCEKSTLEKPTQFQATQDLVEGFFKLTRTNLPQGISALYVHTKQKAQIFDFKTQSLKQFYNIKDAQILKLFNINQTSDEQNLAKIMDIIQHMNQEDKIKAYKGAIYSIKLLWRFLDDLSEEANLV